MASDVKLKPGWLTRDVSQAAKRASEWESSAVKGRTQDPSAQKSGGDQSGASNQNKTDQTRKSS